MDILNKNSNKMLNGVMMVVLFSVAAMWISEVDFVSWLGLSPLIIGIVLGMVYANTLRGHLPKDWGPGVQLCAKKILRLAIILFGFRITFQDIAAVGLDGFLVSAMIVISTFTLGTYLGQKFFGLDKDTSILVSAGSAICGAAAVLATESVLNAKPYKSAVAVGTVVVFGTLAMFLYPILYKSGILNMTPEIYGVYAGGTIHEVAQVVGAGSAVSAQAADTAVIVKMTRVMMLAPMMIVIGLLFVGRKNGDSNGKLKVVIPWFAVLFIVMAGINSLDILPTMLVSGITQIDTFLLTMAMTALGMESGIDKFKQAGIKPILLATVLFVWLLVGGYFITSLLMHYV